MNNNIKEKESLTTQLNNDNSYIILEDILYYSSPKRGIKSKSNNENKNYIFTPFNSNNEMYNTHFTFNIKESSTDLGSKEEIANTQKSSNIISDFSLLKNSKLDSTNANTNTKEKEKENYIKTNIKEEKEEECEEEKKTKYKNSQNGINKNSQKSNNDYSLNFEEDTEEQNKNNNNNNKKFKRKNRRYCSMDLNDRAKMKKKKETSSKRYVSIDVIDKIKKEKKSIKINFRSGERTTPNRKNIINERKILKEIKDKLKNENCEIKKRISKNNKNHKSKNSALSYRYPLSSMEDNNLDNNDSNNYKSKTCKKWKRSNNNLNNDDGVNFEDKNFISHPIKYSNNKDELYKNIFNNKSSRFIKKNQFSLIKEIDKDYDEKVKREIQSAKKINKLKNSKKKNKKNKKHYTEKPKKYENRIIDDKNAKEVSDFVDLKESKNHRSKKTIKNKCSSPNIFRKGNTKNKEKNNDNNNYNLLKSKKSTQIILLNNNNRLKLKSSITLNKKEKKKSTENNTAEKQSKKALLRRHTIFITSKKNQNFLTKKNDNSSFSSENNGIIESSDNGYDQDCSSDSSSAEQNNKLKEATMKIGQITEDKLVLNYQDKKETIEVLSDKENIDNYYEYLDLCLETLQDMNIKEVPKSKAKINFNFPKENQNKKIALFDLDETLVHCIGEINKNNCNKIEYKDSHKIKVVLPCKKEVTIGINVRPHWKESLDKIKEKYNIVIFTASHQSYSDAVLNYLDPEDIYFHYRLYRDSCALYKTSDINFYVKDLDIFKDNYNLKDIIIIDNSILSFAYHINNGIPVVPFYDSKQDSELPLLCFYLLLISSYKDLRDANKEHIKLEYFLSQNKNDISSIDKETMLKEICEKDNESNNNSLDNDKKSEKNSKICSNEENKDNENNNNNDKEKDDIIGNKSEKRLFNVQAHKILLEKKKYNTVKIDSLNFVDFFDKWKNAYLKLALKK